MIRKEQTTHKETEEDGKEEKRRPKEHEIAKIY
jgi:hypothetical protein